MGNIYFFSEKIRFVLKHKKILRSWIHNIINEYGRNTGELTYIFCDDAYLLELNKKFLDHDTYTDILTFDLGEDEEEISGEIYISVERIRENAKKFKQSPDNELHRVMIHGVLHLLGYQDASGESKKEMRIQEQSALNKLVIRK